MNIEIADQPYGGLPTGERTVFAVANVIEGVIVEFRFVGNEKVDLIETLPEAIELFSNFGATKIEPFQQNAISVNLNAEGAANSSVAIMDSGWRITDPELDMIFTLTSGLASIQLRTYASWSETIVPKLYCLLQAVEKLAKPKIVSRVGLRYINRLIGEEGKSCAQWSGRIKNEFLGPISSSSLGPKIRDSQQILGINLEPGIGANLRHGPLVDASSGQGNYIIDIDVFNEISQPIEIESLMLLAQRLNRTAFSIFKLMMTENEISNLNSDSLSLVAKEG